MNEQRSWTVPKIIYAVLMSFLLLGYMIIIATYKDYTATGQTYSLPILFWILRIITAILAIWLGKLWKDKCFLILMAYLLLKAVRVAMDNPADLFDQGVSESLLTGFWVFSACYSLAKILDKSQLKKYLSINAAIWTAGMVIYSSIGIYAAWTEKYIYTIGQGSYWGIYKNRLFLSYYVTTSGSVLSISAVIAFAGAFIAQKRQSKVFFAVSLFPIIIALCLTDARGAQVSIASGIATMIGISVIRWLTFQKKKISRWIIWPMSVVITVGIFVLCTVICSKTISCFNYFKTRGLLVPVAFAEQEDIINMSNRGFFGYDMFSARNLIWEYTLHTIQSHPTIIVFGASIHDPMSYVNPIMWITAAHTHCMPLMVLFENGIPGFLLIFSFLGIAGFRSVRLVVSSENKWERFLVPVILSVAVGELVECFTWLRSGQCPTLSFFFVAIGVIMTVGQKADKSIIDKG